MLSKKILLLTALSALTLTACQKKTAEINLDGSQSPDEIRKEAGELANAIQSGKSIRCNMTNTVNNGQAEYILKGEKMKMTGTGFSENQQSGGMISDGTYIYTWDDITQKGVKMKAPDKETVESAQQEAEQMTRDVPDFSNDADLQKYEDSGYQINCNPEDVNDAEFMPPADVVFSDLSSLMEQIPQDVSEGMTKEQQQALDEFMKQNDQ